jgi:hypothetical protein
MSTKALAITPILADSSALGELIVGLLILYAAANIIWFFFTIGDKTDKEY